VRKEKLKGKRKIRVKREKRRKKLRGYRKKRRKRKKKMKKKSVPIVDLPYPHAPSRKNIEG